MPSECANDGVWPRRIACAPCTIMLPAAWRKMWVRRVVGTSSEPTSSANGLPAPTGASWSASPTSTTCVSSRRPRAAASRAARDSPSTSRRRSADRSASGSCSSCSGPSPGTHPSAEWTVRARTPLASVIRTAARPVGATSRTRARWATAADAIDLIEAVLPVPGPPVITDRRCSKAAASAPRCSSVGRSTVVRVGRVQARRWDRRRSAARPARRARPRARRSAAR